MRIVATLAAAAAGIGLSSAKIEWGETTSSSSEDILTVSVGELTTIIIEPGERANLLFTGASSNHFAVSYKQCSLDDRQPLQIQYSEKLQYENYLGGCVYAENYDANIGEKGCTFWDLIPAGNYKSDGIIYEDSEPLEPGRVRFSNQGNQNATVQVVMFSEDVPVPPSISDIDTWVEDDFIKKDGVVNTSVNVFFNNEDNYCLMYDCTVSGYLNDYVEGTDELSLCQVQANGTVVYDAVPFDENIALTFDVPARGDYYVTLILAARETEGGSERFAVMQEFGFDQMILLQTSTALPDSGAMRASVGGLSALTMAGLILLNSLLIRDRGAA